MSSDQLSLFKITPFLIQYTRTNAFGRVRLYRATEYARFISDARLQFVKTHPNTDVDRYDIISIDPVGL